MPSRSQSHTSDELNYYTVNNMYAYVYSCSRANFHTKILGYDVLSPLLGQRLLYNRQGKVIRRNGLIVDARRLRQCMAAVRPRTVRA